MSERMGYGEEGKQILRERERERKREREVQEDIEAERRRRRWKGGRKER